MSAPNANKTTGYDHRANPTPHHPRLHLLLDPMTQILSLGNKHGPYLSFGGRNKLPLSKGGTLFTPRSFHIGSAISAWWLVCYRKTWQMTHPVTLSASKLVVSINIVGKTRSPSSDHLQMSVLEIYGSDLSGD